MPIYKEEFLKQVWDYIKSGARKKDVMNRYDCNDQEAMDLYDQAQKIYGRGPRINEKPRKENPEINEAVVIRKAERPKPVYSNDGLSECFK